MPRIEIVPYNPTWPDEFRRIAEPLRTAFGEHALRIDHIGSTSVPGLAAKDVIDLQITVGVLDADAIRNFVAPLGYTLHQRINRDHIPPGGAEDSAEWSKLLLEKPETQRRTNVHVRQAGRANQRFPILFRDYLRASPAACEAYRRVKVAMAQLHPDDMGAYSDVKDPVCDLIIDSAEMWVRDTGWSMRESDA